VHVDFLHSSQSSLVEPAMQEHDSNLYGRASNALGCATVGETQTARGVEMLGDGVLVMCKCT
jgi:hypothetical protein